GQTDGLKETRACLLCHQIGQAAERFTALLTALLTFPQTPYLFSQIITLHGSCSHPDVQQHPVKM
ncbi:hypothetical protein, partial [Methanogenium sp. MK-MG]|uniref:hypothetical protein n=1 Tax=Methanogenium sp. MK-MG TaxID=2599926 RepID=UPI001C204C38